MAWATIDPMSPGMSIKSADFGYTNHQPVLEGSSTVVPCLANSPKAATYFSATAKLAAAPPF